MKLLKKWALPLCALLLAAAGAALPYAAAAVQDAQVSHMRENRLLEEVNLTLQRGGETLDMLRLAAGPNLGMPWDGETRLTAAEAANAARTFAEKAAAAGMIPGWPEAIERGQMRQQIYDEDVQLYGGIAVEPYLLVSQEESSLSGVFWSCWGDGLPSGNITIDDSTGMMVQMILSTEVEDPAFSELKFSAAALEKARDWADFLSGYYGTALTIEDQQEYSSDVYAEYSLSFPYGESRRTCRLLLEGWNSIVSFNS